MMLVRVLILTLFASLTLGCPDAKAIHPCTCESPGSFDVYITCSNLDNEQDLVNAAGSLLGWGSIRSFSITNSVINFIPSEAFNGMKFVELNIKDSTLMALTDTDIAFKGLERHLEFFTMTNCTLMNEWEWTILKNLKQLTKLNILEGDLENIEDLGKINLENLKEIAFTENRINFIHDEAFANCKNLMILNLANNNIFKIKRSMLPNPATELLDFDLSYNNIEQLPGDIFTNMPKLQHLSIGNNKILFLDEKIFASIWSQLETFNAMGNQLSCDCRLIWILNKKQPESIRASCAKPQELKGKSLASLSSKELWCYLA